jgi:hypothetical protein
MAKVTYSDLDASGASMPSKGGKTLLRVPNHLKIPMLC